MARKRALWTKKQAGGKKKKAEGAKKTEARIPRAKKIFGQKKVSVHGQIKIALPFLAGIGFFFLIFFLIISSINLYPLKSFVATASSGLLSVFGVPNQLVFSSEPTIVVSGVNAQITNLCAGDIEIALLFAIILATWDRSWRKRIIGCVLGFLAVMILNPIRIAAVLAAGNSLGWNAADAIHSILFRAMLLALIIGYYFVWYVKYDDIAAKFTLLTEKRQKKYKKS